MSQTLISEYKLKLIDKKLLETKLKEMKSLIEKEPKIIDKIEIIWLGGNELGYKDNLEYNFKQDVEAVKTVFNQKLN